MKIKVLILAMIILLTLPQLHALSIYNPNSEIEITYHHEKSSETFVVSSYFFVYNGSGASVSVKDKPSEIDVGFTPSEIEKDEETKVKVNFTIPYNLDEKTYTVTIQVGSDITTFYITINWPPPTINVTWENANWGNIRAGSKITKKLYISEVYGFKGASNLSLKLLEYGPIELEYSSDIGDLAPKETKTITITAMLPEKDLRPDNYSITPKITTPTPSTINYQKAYYTIPYPIFKVSPLSLDFGNVTFEFGKDTANAKLTLSEKGNFTPVEGIKIKRTSGEDGWITFAKIDYLAPGETKTIDFTLVLPGFATLGKKTWSFEISTRYAGKKEIAMQVVVYFPGIEEALSYIEKVKPLEKYPETSELIEKTSLLLQEAKGKTNLRDIAMVMSVYSGIRSFITHIENGKIVMAKKSENKIKIGSENIADKSLKEKALQIYDISSRIWANASEEELSELLKKAEDYKESNYKLAALTYKELSEIYEIKGNKKKADEYERLKVEMEEKYKNNIENATLLSLNAEQLSKNAFSKTISIGDYHLLLNPFAYDYVFNNLNLALGELSTAKDLYLKAGEINDAEKISLKIEELRSEKEKMKNFFLAYGVLLVLIFIFIVIRTCLGIIRYRRDEKYIKIGEFFLEYT